LAGKGKVKKRRPFRDEITDLPNLITLARIGTLPLVLLFIDNYSRVASFVSAMIFLVGGLSDSLDGYLARKRGQITVVGQFLDPLADKLFVLGTLIYLTAHDRVAEWLVVLLMSREIAITGLRAVASSYGLVIAAGAGGKAKTALQTAGIIFLLIHFRYPILFFGVYIDFHQVGTYLVFASLVMSLWSAGEYFRFFVNAAEEQARRSAHED
jgi:CDP-diacylglycerol--glycerol-3-phosphate 3-phosphatidyltransferase